ncbi:MAG: histidine--tRNA ligase [Anaerolineae bacterium]
MYKAPRGTQDILPSDQPHWQWIRGWIEELCPLYGYERIDKPLFEATELFTRGVGESTEVVEKQMYTFQDKGGNSLTLLPEATAPVMRAYLEHGMHVLAQPVKLYAILPIFRHDRPQAGRYRQFSQLNCEAIGEADPAVDAESIALAWKFFHDLGLRELSLQLNSIGDGTCRPGYLESLVAHYRDHEDEICDECRERMVKNPMRLMDCKRRRCQPVIDGSPKSAEFLCGPCDHHFRELRRPLDRLGLLYHLNHRLARGLDYYTRTVFEVWAPGIGAQAALVGGGRYDGLAEVLGGRPTPGVGFAAGLERTVLALKAQDLEPPSGAALGAFLAYLGDEEKAEAFSVAERLRAEGIPAVLGFGNRSLKAQMREADRSGAAYVLIVGAREREAGIVTVRDLATGTEVPVLQEEVVRWLKERAPVLAA